MDIEICEEQFVRSIQIAQLKLNLYPLKYFKSMYSKYFIVQFEKWKKNILSILRSK